MTTRREARECAVQLLFQLELNPDDLEKTFISFWNDRKADAKARKFTEKVVRGVLENLGKIDGVIKKHAEHWDIQRMGVVERSVMRMALYEMLFCNDIPPIVSINEAVDIAKYFSNNMSGKFVNGILDCARKDLSEGGSDTFISTST